MNKPIIAEGMPPRGKPQEQILLQAGVLLVEISDHLFWLSLRTDRAKLIEDVAAMHRALQPRLIEAIEAIRAQLPEAMVVEQALETPAIPKEGAA